MLPYVNHLNAAISTQKDKDITINNIHDQVTIQGVLQDILVIEKKTNKDSYAQCVSRKRCKFKDVTSKTDINLDQDLISELNMYTKLYNKKLEADKINEQSMNISHEVNTQLSNHRIELTSTPSGKLAIELDERVIDIIENKLLEDPKICLTAKKTNSGHYNLDLNTVPNALEEYQKITMKNTVSGSKFFEINKIIGNELNCINTQYQNKDEIDLNPVYLQDTKNERMLHTNMLVDNQYENEEEKIIDFTYLRCFKNTTLRVLSRNSMCKDVQAPVIRTLSDNVAIDMKAILSFGEISFMDEEYPVIVEKTSSDRLLLDIGSNKEPNATLRRTSSEGIILVDRKPLLKSVNTIKKLGGNNTFFKVKIKGMTSNIKESPAILCVTPSNNYIIVLDKEYQNNYLRTINEYIGEDNKCLVELHRTASDSYLIILGGMDKMSIVAEKNALLVKSQPGYIKILVNTPIFDGIDQFVLRKTSTSSVKTNENLMRKLSNSSKDLHVISFEKNLNHSKFNNDSELYNTDKRKLEARSLITLRRTSSGHYEVVLNNEDESKVEYESLKMSPSGNIYVIVDDKDDQGSSKGSDTINGNIRSTHLIGEIKQPVNKCVTTTCNARPGSSFCQSSKCVCDKLDVIQRWLQNSTINENVKLFQPENCSINFNNVKSEKRNEKRVCVSEKGANLKKSSHVKPCESRLPVGVNDSKTKDYMFILDAVCPSHVGRCGNVSSKLSEKSGFCKESTNIRADDVVLSDCEKCDDNWDSLSYLPPQLPTFLNGFKYR